ncbi:hypothetical protein Cgig2_015397 [Carnegiea gigantea]|uniref:Uncharacterized protein n=1 Tax=Carnegiea gigantea TaxID=171969 RepID=A0A9Q1JU12_9CARY|nr:hypothetical protein Cgig2_015397 [Carnegiea gigantea]
MAKQNYYVSLKSLERNKEPYPSKTSRPIKVGKKVAMEVMVVLSTLAQDHGRPYLEPTITSSSCSSSETVPERSADAREEGRYLQFPNLPTKIDGRVAAEWKLAQTKQTAWLKTVPKLMAKGYSTGNSRSSFGSLQRSIEVPKILLHLGKLPTKALEGSEITHPKATAKAKETGFQHGQEEQTEFFRALLVREGFFEAWVRYVEDRHCTIQASEDPNEVVFSYEVSDTDPDSPGSTAPLDGGGEEGSDDEDPDALDNGHLLIFISVSLSCFIY